MKGQQLIIQPLKKERYHDYKLANGNVHSIIALFNALTSSLNKHSEEENEIKEGDFLYDDLVYFRENLISIISPITHQSVKNDYELVEKVKLFLAAFEIKGTI